MNKEFERTCYVGDIHSNRRFLDLVKSYNDGRTRFLLLGDFFDKGDNSVEVYLKIKELKEKGILDGVLGNHDLFFIFTFLPNIPEYIRKKYRGTLMVRNNGGYKTLEHFRAYFKSQGAKTEEDITKEFVKVAKWLFNNFEIYYEDKELNNFLVHGGIAISPNGRTLGDFVGDKWLEGISLIKEWNKRLKELDTVTLNKFTGIYPTRKSLIENVNRKNLTEDEAEHINMSGKGIYYDYLLPTWYHNIQYHTNEKKYRGLMNYLDKNLINRLIVGHDYYGGNTLMVFDEKEQFNRVVNLDRGGDAIWKGDVIERDRGLGYILLNNKNEIEFTKDAFCVGMNCTQGDIDRIMYHYHPSWKAKFISYSK